MRAGKTYGGKGAEGHRGIGRSRAGRKGTEGIAASGGARKADGTPLLSCNKKISAKRAALRKSFKKGMRSENLSDRFLQPKVNGWNCCNCKFFRASRPK